MWPHIEHSASPRSCLNLKLSRRWIGRLVGRWSSELQSLSRLVTDSSPCKAVLPPRPRLPLKIHLSATAITHPRQKRLYNELARVPVY
jgi:hypothetical protein